MSPMGRPEGEWSRSAVSAEGFPLSPMGRPEGEWSRSAIARRVVL
jgi:hypothetical protein